VAVVGPGAAAQVARHCHSPARETLDSCPPDRFCFARWRLAGLDALEEVVLHVESPEYVEIHCHGGDASVEAILEQLAAEGCEQTGWQGWLRRQSRSEIHYEAACALLEATTERTARVLLDQLHGALEAEVRAIGQLLDKADDCRALDRLRRLLTTQSVGLHLNSPWMVAFAGRPNVGKSCLINDLVGYQRAIVYGQPGTTRDVLTVTTAFEGWPVELADTAGLGASADPIEQAGIQRALETMKAADCVVLVSDRSVGWTPSDEVLWSRFPGAILVHNKCDLPAGASGESPAGMHVSALTRQGVAALAETIARRLVPHAPDPVQGVLFSRRQVEWAERAAEALEEGRQALAQKALLSLVSDPGELGNE
jgi:tRNA modification GTPase